MGRVKLYRNGVCCYWCGMPVRPDEASRDHVIPVSRGGARGASNIVLTHKKCNEARTNKLPSEMEIVGIPIIKAIIRTLKREHTQISVESIMDRMRTRRVHRTGEGFVREYLRRHPESWQTTDVPRKHQYPC